MCENTVEDISTQESCGNFEHRAINVENTFLTENYGKKFLF